MGEARYSGGEEGTQMQKVVREFGLAKIQFPSREYNPIKLMGSQFIKKLSKPLCTRIHSNTS